MPYKKKLHQLNHRIPWHRLFLELVVVFLGVTAGFLLNNLREDRKSSNLEFKYLNSFVQNIDTNIVRLREMIIADSIWLDRNRKGLEYFQNRPLNPDSVGTFVGEIIFTSSMILQTNTFEDIKFSGNLNLISDFDIKEQIVSYHKDIEEVLYINEFYNSFFTEFVLPMILSEFDLQSNTIVNPDGAVLIGFSNVYLGYYSLRYQRVGMQDDLLNASYSLRSALEKYLEQMN